MFWLFVLFHGFILFKERIILFVITKLIASPIAEKHNKFFTPNIFAAGAAMPAAKVITIPMIMAEMLEGNEDPVVSNIVSV